MGFGGCRTSGLQAAFERLDTLIARAVEQMQTHNGASDPFRGLHIDETEVQRLLTCTPGQPHLWTDDLAIAQGIPDVGTPFGRLVRQFDLASFDLDVIALALAPEFDLRYERLYAYLQDDVTRRRPQVDLALNLLCQSAEERIARRAHFMPDAPLIRHGLVTLVQDAQMPYASLLAHSLKLDEQVVGWLLGNDCMHPRLAGACERVTPQIDMPALVLPDAIKCGLPLLAQRAASDNALLRLHFYGPDGVGKRTAAEAVAKAMGVDLIEADVAKLAVSGAELQQCATLLAREAIARNAVLFIEGLNEAQWEAQAAGIRQLLAVFNGHAGIVIVSGPTAWDWGEHAGPQVTAIRFEAPDFEQRHEMWRAQLTRASVDCSEQECSELAGRFRLTPGQIARAVAQAGANARWRQMSRSAPGGGKATVLADDLFHAVRAQAGQELARLACKIEPKRRWADIVLPEEPMRQLRDLCAQVMHHHTVYDTWGFGRKLSSGKGVNALFSGPPGTGKTMAAEVIANDLNLDLYKIDLSQIVSKYIGETEKNLDRIFRAAHDANAILFFDEADALFGKRSEVKDSHDRYANIEVGYLLQKMEEFEGVAILATNLRRNLDEAFVRRMHAIVEFPFPDEEYRRRIWEGSFPREAPVGKDVDFATLAREVRLAGGSIKNIALAAAFSAARDGGIIDMPAMVQAIRREHQKFGRTWNEAQCTAADQGESVARLRVAAMRRELA